jgi:hypothetical protein
MERNGLDRAAKPELNGIGHSDQGVLPVDEAAPPTATAARLVPGNPARRCSNWTFTHATDVNGRFQAWHQAGLLVTLPNSSA